MGVLQREPMLALCHEVFSSVGRNPRAGLRGGS